MIIAIQQTHKTGHCLRRDHKIMKPLQLPEFKNCLCIINDNDVEGDFDLIWVRCEPIILS